MMETSDSDSGDIDIGDVVEIDSDIEYAGELINLSDQEDFADGDAAVTGSGGSPIINERAQGSSKRKDLDGGTTEQNRSGPPRRKQNKMANYSPEVGDHCFAMWEKEKPFGPWHRAKIIEIVHNGPKREMEYIVEDEQWDETFTFFPRTLSLCDVKLETKKVFRKHTALPHLATNQKDLNVMTRVIAKYKAPSNSKIDGLYHAGIIIERFQPPGFFVVTEYLVLFDNGCAHYVPTDNVRVVRSDVKDILNISDVNPDISNFVHEYFERLKQTLQWPKVRVSEGQIISAGKNNEWSIARVLKLDRNTAKISFNYDDSEEWIFLGSAGLRPILPEFLKQRSDQELLTIPQFPLPTSWKQDCFQQVEIFSGCRQNIRIDLRDLNMYSEFQGTLKEVKRPRSNITWKKYVAHDCDSSCVTKLRIPETIKIRNPLWIPYLFGWTRRTSKSGKCTFAYYRAPCGKLIQTEEELICFLELTHSNLYYNYFSFDASVDCGKEFFPARVMFEIDDASDGKDPLAPLQCVNSLDHEEPPKFEYIQKNVMGADVNVNEDERCMLDGHCCECNDNCLDKTKCSCWQRTLSGASFQNLGSNRRKFQGFEGIRIVEHVASGIFECNDQCTCKKTCVNRSSQNLAKWPLQLFKTQQKGWAVRARCDIPKGVFVSNLAGEILDSETADQVEMNSGNEYFLQLDFPKICKRLEDRKTSRYCHQPTTERSTSRIMCTTRNEPSVEDADSVSLDNGLLSIKQELELNDIKKELDMDELQKKCYVLDSKKKGNVIRYFNHSCRPNLFPQNVFVNQRDLRFPQVAFFTSEVVKAGSELTWDYAYEPGSELDVGLKCVCRVSGCEGRFK